MVRWLTVALALPLLTGCAVHLIAPYDATLDAAMVGVQADTEFFLNRMVDAGSGDPASYARNLDFYQRTEATLHTLLLRVQATPKSDRVADQIQNLERTVELMQRTHRRDDVLAPAAIASERALLESQFRSFFALELALQHHFKQPLPIPPVAPALPGTGAGGTP